MNVRRGAGLVLRITLLAAPLFASDPRFHDELWVGIEPLYQKTIDHPFFRAFLDGTLSQSKFDAYLARETRTRESLAAALTALAAKAPSEEWRVTLANLRVGIPTVSEELRTGPFANVARGSFADGLTTILPHFWIHWELAKDLQKHDNRNPA